MGEQEEVVVSGKARAVQVQRRNKRNKFGMKRRATFLTVLAATCNVRLAAERAGVTTTTAYRVRRMEPAFATLWREAIVAGYERLETALLARAMGTDSKAMAGFEFGDPEAVLPEGEIDADLALRLLNRNRAKAEGSSRPARAGRHVATEAETNAALLKKLAVLRRQLAQGGGPILIEARGAAGEAAVDAET